MRELPQPQYMPRDRYRSVFHKPLDLEVVYAGLVLILLNLWDAAATLYNLNRGMTELNPMMRLALDHGPACFVIVKYLMMAVGVLWITVYSQYRFAKVAIRILVSVYMILGAYQLWLILYV